MICDYFVIRRRVLQVEDYISEWTLRIFRGFNWRAVIALVLGAGTALAGLAIPSMRALYDYSWFSGFAVPSFAIT